MNDSDYRGPVRLQRKIPWGKRDRATGFAVCENVRDTMPPVVLDWHPKMRKTMETLSHDKVHVLRVDDLRDVLASKRAHIISAIEPKLLPGFVARTRFVRKVSP